MPDISLQAGQINIKGPQAATGVDRWISGQAILAFTGLALTVAGLVIAPQNAGAETFAGLTPTVTVAGTGTTVNNPAGAMTWQGLTPTVRTGDLIFTPDAAQIVIKGPARPTVVPALGVGSLVYTGRTLNAIVDVPGSALSIPLGQIVLTGLAPDRILTQAINVPVGAMAISGLHVAVAFTPPGTGSLVWQGLAPTIGSTAVGLAIPKGTLTIGGDFTLRPVAAVEFFHAVPAGSLVLTGRDPNVAHSPSTIVLPTGAATLTGLAPTIDASAGLQAGAITLTGAVLTLQEVAAAQGIPVGAITFTGYGFDVVHSNGTIITSVVRLTRSLSGPGTIRRTVTSEVTR